MVSNGKKQHNQRSEDFQLYRKKGRVHRYYKDKAVAEDFEISTVHYGYAERIQGGAGRGGSRQVGGNGQALRQVGRTTNAKWNSVLLAWGVL